MPHNPYEELLVALADGGVLFMTVGGIACALNGHVRSTQDVDILVKADAANIERLLAVLSHFGEGSARELSVVDFPLEAGAVRIIEDFPLDVFTLMMNRSYEDLLDHMLWWESDGARIPYLDAEGLILLKSSSPRPKDQLDIVALRSLTHSA